MVKKLKPSKGTVQTCIQFLFPFEQVWLRCLLSICIITCIGVAATAAFVIKPEMERLDAEASELLQLEEAYLATLISDRDLGSLEARAATARETLYPNEDAVDKAIIKILHPLQENGWKTVVASIEKDSEQSTQLSLQRYRIEFSFEPSVVDLQILETGLQQLTDVLKSIDESGEPLNVEHFRVISEEVSVKSFITLAAAVRK